MSTVTPPSEQTWQQTLERFIVGLEVTQLVLFPDGEHVHIFLSPTGGYERQSILTIQATDDGLMVDIIGPDVPDSPLQKLPLDKPRGRKAFCFERRTR